MLFWLAKKDMKHVAIMKILEMTMISVVYISIIVIVSAIKIKTKDYAVVKPYLYKKGVLIQSIMLSKAITDGGTLLRDDKELQDYLTRSEDVISTEILWHTRIDKLKKSVAVWCYSKEITDRMKPEMYKGRWFNKKDYHSEVLKGVVSYNGDILNVGDIVTIKNDELNVESQVEIIGVLEDNQRLFCSNIYKTPTEDYRDLYSLYSYENDKDEVFLFLSDEQIIRGEHKGYFEFLNYRLNNNQGFQKEMTGATIITYPENTSIEIIESDIEKLQDNSLINKIYNLADINANSKAFIFDDLYTYLPLLIIVIIFVIISAVSVNTIMIKKQMRTYSVYYICGLTWKRCAVISLMVSLITSSISLLMVLFSLLLINESDFKNYSALSIGIAPIVSCLCMLIIYTFIAWLIPLFVVRKKTARSILINNYSL